MKLYFGTSFRQGKQVQTVVYTGSMASVVEIHNKTSQYHLSLSHARKYFSSVRPAEQPGIEPVLANPNKLFWCSMSGKREWREWNDG